MPVEIAHALVDRCRLIKLKGKTKAAMESGWNTDKNYPINDPEIIRHVEAGNNFGIMPKNGAVVIDCDTAKLYDGLPEDWKKTLTVITGRNGGSGRHVFLNCPDSPPEKFAISDPKTDHPLGDIRGTNSKFYTVAAGSVHPDTNRKYTYLDAAAPLVTVKWEDIRREVIDRYSKGIQKIIPEFRKADGESLSDKLGLRIEHFAMPVNPVTRPNGDIQGAHPVHGSSTGMNFSINPKSGIWYCYRCGIGGDAVSWLAYTKCGVPEHQCTNLSKENFIKVADWLRANGYKEKFEDIDLEFIRKIQPTKALEDVDVQQIMDDARQAFSLPPFPPVDSNLFNRYVTFGKRVSYSLEEYHFASLMAVVSMALRRKTLIQVGMSKVYPNVFIMITGHTTISGKSTACDMAINNLSPAVVYEDKFKYQGTNLPTGTISEAALVQGLADVYHSLWYYDECASFFDDMAWNKGILPRLCQVYDSGKIERTLSKRAKNKDEYHPVCPWPFMSILFNTTNADLERIATTELFTSGFFPRIMWFYGQGGEPRKNIEIKKEDWDILRGIFLEIQELKVEMDKHTNDQIIFRVCDIIEDWKLSETNKHLGGKEDEAYRTAISRGFIHAYKIAVILAMVDKDFRKTKIYGNFPITIDIPEKYAKEALKIVEKYLMPRMIHVYNLCDNGDMRNHQNITLKALDHFGGVATRSKLLSKTRLSSKDLKTAVDTLKDSGEVIVASKVENGNDKPTTYIIRIRPVVLN
jgi:hypothetical protein